MGGKPCLDTDIIQISVQVPTLFKGNLGKQYPGPSPVDEVETVDSDSD
jgi:hypothetical protein